VEKLVEAAEKPQNHRYSASAGITKLRHAIADWYKRRWGVEIDPEEEAIATIGAKEGLSHFVLATVSPGDVVFAPNPTYPIHPYSVIIAGGDLKQAFPSDQTGISSRPAHRHETDLACAQNAHRLLPS